jgi:hypothetical protein
MGKWVNGNYPRFLVDYNEFTPFNILTIFNYFIATTKPQKS